MGSATITGESADALLERLGTRYALVNRPVGIGTLPRGLLYKVVARPPEGEAHHDMARHGILEADRSLSAIEARAYELAPLVDACAADSIATLVVDEMSRYASEYLRVQEEDEGDFRRYVLDMAQRVVEGVRLSIGDPDAVVGAVTRQLRAKVSQA